MYYDNALLMLINGSAGHFAWLDTLMILLSTYGPLFFGCYLVSLWFYGNATSSLEQNRRRVLYAFFAAMLALGINQLIGIIWFRERPYIDHSVNLLMPKTPDQSFPSDHAAGSFSIASAVAYGKPTSGILLSVLAILVTISRVYVGMHYPSDVLGGMIIGIFSSWIIEKNKTLLEKPLNLFLTLWKYIEAKSPLLLRGH